MVTEREIQKVDAFMQDLFAVCRNHKACFVSSVNIRVDSIPVYSPVGIAPIGKEGVWLEVGSITDSETWTFLPGESTIPVNGVFNSAGVDNPLP